ncbi:hypothetical protein K3495_g5333 [Podosphaera aphanis]|nr:hypothetical protein K3495_g5333 [Podosphaera aphanis]
MLVPESSSAITSQPSPLYDDSSPWLTHDDDMDSTLGEEDGSEAEYCSVTDSVYDYRVENGRTYHAYMDGKYLLPNDEREKDRMDMVYHAILEIFEKKAFFAPVKNPQRIVDMGTGTGIWALDVGDQYPEAHVVGIDLSPIQPKWVSPNVEFRIDDIENPWVFSRPLSLIHSRLMSGHSIRHWPTYLRQCYLHLAPGGWVEAQDTLFFPQALSSGPFPPDSHILKWHELFQSGMRTAGCDLSISAENIRDAMEQAGFVNVRIHKDMLPIGPWCSEPRLQNAGTLIRESFIEGIGGISSAVFTRVLGWEVLNLELFLEKVRKEWRTKDIHGYWPLFSVYGQKPE